jgi:hypothetical protein
MLLLTPCSHVVCTFARLWLIHDLLAPTVAFKLADPAKLPALNDAMLALKRDCVRKDGTRYIVSAVGGKQTNKEGHDGGMQVVFVMEFEVSSRLGVVVCWERCGPMVFSNAGADTLLEPTRCRLLHRARPRAQRLQGQARHLGPRRRDCARLYSPCLLDPAYVIPNKCCIMKAMDCLH